MWGKLCCVKCFGSHNDEPSNTGWHYECIFVNPDLLEYPDLPIIAAALNTQPNNYWQHAVVAWGENVDHKYIPRTPLQRICVDC